MALTAAYVTRASLSLGNLSLADATYKIRKDAFDPGAVAWRRQWATSPFVHGSIEVNATKDITHGAMTVLVRGASASAIQTSVTTLITAMSQSTFALHVTLDGTDWAWTCYRADYSVRFNYQLVKAVMAECHFEMFRKPIPAAGPF